MKQKKFARLGSVLNRMFDQPFHKVEWMKLSRIKKWEVMKLNTHTQINLMKMLKTFQLYPRVHKPPKVTVHLSQLRRKRSLVGSKNHKILFKEISKFIQIKMFKRFQFRKVMGNNITFWKTNLRVQSFTSNMKKSIEKMPWVNNLGYLIRAAQKAPGSWVEIWIKSMQTVTLLLMGSTQELSASLNGTPC